MIQTGFCAELVQRPCILHKLLKREFSKWGSVILTVFVCSAQNEVTIPRWLLTTEIELVWAFFKKVNYPVDNILYWLQVKNSNIFDILGYIIYIKINFNNLFYFEMTLSFKLSRSKFPNPQMDEEGKKKICTAYLSRAHEAQVKHKSFLDK